MESSKQGFGSMGQDLERASKCSVEGVIHCDSISLQIDAAIFCYRNRKALFANPMVKLLKQTSYKTVKETLLLSTTWDNTWH